MKDNKEHVFGLDIGTRSIVGTVGYRDEAGRFVVLAQVSYEHETRAVIDGQIHDIRTVAKTINKIKEELEQVVGYPLRDVCIAAAGRVLKTKRVMAEYKFVAETKVTEEHVRALDMLGVEKAYEEIRAELEDERMHFYCVGYSTVEYYLNGYSMEIIESHKANQIGVELIATFLPDEVVDGLYEAVEEAGLRVANLTLEPIAAIQVAIQENFRLLNIALLDVGAGTSDISIVKDGSIIAFGMMPLAGDEITETIARKYLIDFQTAEKVKKSAMRRKQVSFKNIMGESVKVTREELLLAIDGAVADMTKQIAEKIKELNGGKPVSAVFVVGGGGKLEGFVGHLAQFLDLPENRVAIRGAEVLREVVFEQANIKKDSTLVTPIGICLNFYEEKNNFIHVSVNDTLVKLYNNNKLTVLDAALRYGYKQEELFPARGSNLSYVINGESQIVKGHMGEAAVITVGGETAGLNTPVGDKDNIKIVPATKGEDGKLQIGGIKQCKNELCLTVCQKPVIITCPIKVAGEEVPSFYEIKEGDRIEANKECTLEQVLRFAELDLEREYEINGKLGKLTSLVKEGDSICEVVKEEVVLQPEKTEESKTEVHTESVLEPVAAAESQPVTSGKIMVQVNGTQVMLEDKETHIFVDVFDVYPFDMTKAGGRRLITRVNGLDVDFTFPIKQGDNIDLTWSD